MLKFILLGMCSVVILTGCRNLGNEEKDTSSKQTSSQKKGTSDQKFAFTMKDIKGNEQQLADY